jgi:hypothetical protein
MLNPATRAILIIVLKALIALFNAFLAMLEADSIRP